MYTKGRTGRTNRISRHGSHKSRRKKVTKKVTKTRQDDEDHTRGIMPETSRGGRGNLPLHKERTRIGARTHTHTETDRRGRQWDDTGETHQGGANNQRTAAKLTGHGGKRHDRAFKIKQEAHSNPDSNLQPSLLSYCFHLKLHLTHLHQSMYCPWKNKIKG